MEQVEYTVEVESSTRPKVLIATSPDIRGLVLETASVEELHRELLLVAPELLKMNHGLTDEQIANVQLNVTLKERSGKRMHTRRPPRILFDDQRAAAEPA